jgi:hypothetical protein
LKEEERSGERRKEAARGWSREEWLQKAEEEKERLRKDEEGKSD